MDKETQLSLVVQARKRAENSSAAIAAQLAIIRDLERQGANTETANSSLIALILVHDADMAILDRLLDEMDQKAPKRLDFHGASEKNLTHKITQPERARGLAAQHGPSAVADLLEMHAQLCERNAARMASKVPRRPK